MSTELVLSPSVFLSHLDCSAFQNWVCAKTVVALPRCQVLRTLRDYGSHMVMSRLSISSIPTIYYKNAFILLKWCVKNDPLTTALV